MNRIVLVGDSVLDNGAYVGGGPDIQQQLADELGSGSEVQLLAVDGAVTNDVLHQINAIPSNVAHIFLSAGGNDALEHLDVLGHQVRSVAEALVALGPTVEDFRERYRKLLTELAQWRRPLCVCTIYDPQFENSELNKAASVALRLFNDAIAQEASMRGASVIDLRMIFTEPTDYANAIEPSARGGAKLAAAMAARIRLQSPDPSN